jgi:hypothetical protein
VRNELIKNLILRLIGDLIRRPMGVYMADEADKAEWTNMKIPIGEAEKSIEEIFYY